MRRPSVSVVMPTNRGGPFLREAVASLRAQTVPIEEVILVDDGSPAPGLGTIAAELQLSYVRQAAAGIAAARNTGVARSRAHWIAFLDDDDVWHPERLEAQFRALAQRPDAVASHTGGWYMDSDGAPFGEGWPAPAATSSEMISAAVIAPRITTLLVRRDVYERVGGCRSDMEPAEDNELILRLLQQGEFVAVDRPLVGYRRHSANVTLRGLAGRMANRRAILGQLEQARAAGDVTAAGLLAAHLSALKDSAAAENLGDLITAARAREWRYACRVMWWGARTVPLQSIRAALSRVRRRGIARSARESEYKAK